jgi:hypothetical protein
MTILKFWIPGPLPGRNEQEAAARGNKFAGASMKKKWTEHVARCCSGTGKYFKRVFVDFIWYEPNRRRDPDNISGGQKFCFDGLKYAGLIPNDGWKNIEGFTHDFKINKESPGVAIVVKEVK